MAFEHKITNKPPWFLDLVFSPEKQFCRVSCDDKLNTKNVPPEEILQQFSNFDTVNHILHYIDDGLLPDGNVIPLIMIMSVDTATNGNIASIFKVIPRGCLKDLLAWFPVELQLKEFMLQFCVFFDCGGVKVVIPCNLLGAIYYFNSTTMRKAVFAQDLSSLYEQIAFDKSSATVAISLTGGGTSDAVYIARFLLDEFAQKRFNSVLNNIRRHYFYNGHSEQVPLQVGFPVKQKIRLVVDAIEFKSPAGNRFALVQRFRRENSQFPFSRIIVRRTKGLQASGIARPPLSELVTIPTSRLIENSPYAGLVYGQVDLSSYWDNQVLDTKFYASQWHSNPNVRQICMIEESITAKK